jgi:hypothetical protein
VCHNFVLKYLAETRTNLGISNSYATWHNPWEPAEEPWNEKNIFLKPLFREYFNNAVPTAETQ